MFIVPASYESDSYGATLPGRCHCEAARLAPTHWQPEAVAARQRKAESSARSRLRLTRVPWCVRSDADGGPAPQGSAGRVRSVGLTHDQQVAQA